MLLAVFMCRSHISEGKLTHRPKTTAEACHMEDR